MKRTELREHIFKLVFGVEFNPPEELHEQIQLYLEQEEIDSLINKQSARWKTKRMNKADLSILRLAVYEMKMDEDVPVSVAINEAVELAKRFGGEDSSSFINGVLAKLVD